MSNHIRNILMADFESEGAVKAFLAKVKGAEHDFSFQAYTPMPRTLLIPEPCNDEFIYAVVKDYGLKLDQYPENIKKAVKQCFWPFKEEKDVTYGDLYSAYGRAEKRRVHLPDETEDSKPCDSKENVLGEDYFIRIKADFDVVGAYALQNVRRYVFSAEKNGVEYYIFAEDFTPKLCDFANEIQKALDGRMAMIRTYVESNSDYKEAFGKLDGEQRKKLLLHPQVNIFSDGGTITWLGSKYVTDKMISINFFGAVDELGTVEILDI